MTSRKSQGTELVVAAQAGDRKALNSLLESEYDRIYAVCRRITGNDADAADGTQEALVAIVRGLPQFDARSKFSTWAYRVATNACLDELRRRKRRPLPVDPSAGAAGGQVDFAPEDTRSGSAGGMQSHDNQIADRLLLTAALDELVEEFRLPIILRDIMGHDYAEIAELLSIPPGTVRSRIARGRKHLAKVITESGQISSEPGNHTMPVNVIQPTRLPDGHEPQL